MTLHKEEYPECTESVSGLESKLVAGYRVTGRLGE